MINTKYSYNQITFRVAIAVTLTVFLLGCGKPQKSFLNNIGICTSLSNDSILNANGYTYIEEGVRRFLIPDKSEEEFNKLLAQSKASSLPVVACNSFLPGSLKSVGEEAVHDEILEFSETAFRRAQLVGVKIIVFGSGGSRKIPEGFPREDAKNQFVELCKKMGPIAAKYDVTIVLEPLNRNECNFLNSVSEGGEIVEEVNHPNIRLLADIYHMKVEDEGSESILKYGHLIRHTHIAEKEGRAAPGTNGDDFRPYIEALKEVGYEGAMSVECRWKDMEAQAATAIATIKDQL